MDKQKNLLQEEQELLLTAKSQRESSAGMQSIKLECLGELKEISAQSMIPVAKLVNLGAEVVRVALFEDGLMSDSFTRIKKRASLHPNHPELELYLIKNAIDIMGELLGEDKGEKSTYSRLLQLLLKLKEDGNPMALPEVVEKAVRRALDDPKFFKELLNS